MKAILLCKANREKILESTNILKAEELDRMIGEYDRPEGMKLYFVPIFEDGTGWATLPEEWLHKKYTYEGFTKIETEFVELTDK